MNEILSVENFYIDYSPGSSIVTITARAVIDNMILLHHQTQEEPEEWGPALCETTMTFDDWEEYVRISEEDLTILLEQSDCVWKLYEGDL